MLRLVEQLPVGENYGASKGLSDVSISILSWRFPIITDLLNSHLDSSMVAGGCQKEMRKLCTLRKIKGVL